MGEIRYIGSKARIASAILDFIGAPTVSAGKFVDVLSGTGIVSRFAAMRGWKVLANDHLLSSAILTTARLLSAEDVPFSAFGGYRSAMQELAEAPGTKGFIYREYTPDGQNRCGQVRRYFTPDNGLRIDGMRARIREWHEGSIISGREHYLLLADLMGAANSVANIAGTYGCFLRHWTASALKPIELKPRELLARRSDFEVLNSDVSCVPSAANDTAYIDPPYTKRQYAAYYHVLETIAAGDEPEVDGVSGLRPWKDKLSSFCYKVRALDALERLISNIHAHRIILSYSSEGHMRVEDVQKLFSKYGKVRTNEVSSIGRYRPNQTASARAATVVEYLIELVKPSSVAEVA